MFFGGLKPPAKEINTNRTYSNRTSNVPYESGCPASREAHSPKQPRSTLGCKGKCGVTPDISVWKHVKRVFLVAFEQPKLS